MAGIFDDPGAFGLAAPAAAPPAGGAASPWDPATFGLGAAAGAAPAAQEKPPEQDQGFFSVQGLRSRLAEDPNYVAASILPFSVKSTAPGSGVMDEKSGLAGVKFDPLNMVRPMVNPFLDLLEGTGLSNVENSQLAGKVSPAASALMFGVAAGNPNPFQKSAGLMRPAFSGVADAGPVFGRPPDNALLDEAGAPMRSAATGAPLDYKSKEIRAAAEQNRAAATDPAAVRAKLDNPPVTGLPGDNPTVPKLTGDEGLAAAEYTMSRTGTDPQKGAFTAQANKQNDARVKVLQGLEPDADVGVADAALKAHADAAETAGAAEVARVQAGAAGDVAAADRAGAARVAGLTDAADRTRAGVGGDLPAGSEAAVGTALRAPVAAAEDAARTVRGEMYDAVDPENKLALGVAGVRSGTAEVRRSVSGDAKPIAGEEKAILDQIARWPDVRRFEDLRAMRTRVTDELRDQRAPGGNPQAVRRLSMVLGHLEDAMDGAIGDAEIAPPPASGGLSAGVGGGAAPAVGTRAFTPSGVPVDVRYGVREASELVPSQLPGGAPNPAYPQELQPRDRTRAASQLQVARIAAKLNPEQLGASAATNEGAPIIGADGIVESGNGRTMALQRVYREGGPQAEAYRQWLASQGHDVSGMREPVLVRERVAPAGESLADRAAFAKDAGASPALATSAVERATGDAASLSDGTLQTLRPGAVTDAANRDFVRAFLRDAVEPGGEGGFVAADGSLSKEGAARVEAALVARAYGDQGLTSALAETTDPTARVLAGAMRDAAGPMARLRAGIEAGAVDPAVDLAPALVEATQIVALARRRGISLADAVAQTDAFSQISPVALQVLHEAYGETLSGQMSRSAMTRKLELYAAEAENQATTASLFGANRSASEILQGASSRHGNATNLQPGNASADAGVLGPGAAESGNRGRGPGDGAPGQGTSGGSGGQAATARNILPAAESGLTPNLDAGAIERLRAANAQNVADIARFRGAPGVGDMLAPGPTKGTFRTRPEMVPGIIVRVGAPGAEVARSYLAAGGDPAALDLAAAYSLRQYAARADGTLDPAKVGTWAKDRAGFLSQLPNAARRFQAAADAQRAVEAGTKESAQSLKAATAEAQATVDAAMADAAQARKAMQRSAIGKFLGESDPVAQVWSILNNKPNGRAMMRQLVTAVGGDPAALAGLRAAVAESIDRELVGNSRGPVSESGALRAERLQNLITHGEATLREVMTPEQMDGILSVHDTLVRDYRSGQVGFGSGTGQIQSGERRGVVRQVASAAAGAVTGAGVGALIGGWIAGGAGTLLGLHLGTAVGMVLRRTREAGIQNIADLRTESLLNPRLYRLLDTKLTKQNEAVLLPAIASQLRRSSLVAGAQQQPQGGESLPQPKRNALLH